MSNDAGSLTTSWIAQPEPGLTPEMVVERARALLPLLRQQQN